MSRIFISYRRDDSAGHAGRLHDRLTAAFGEKNVFMDIEGIAPGADFGRAIDDAIDSCQVVLILMGRDWLQVRDREGNRRLDDPGDYPRLELKHALQSGRTVIPVLVRGAVMPAASDLPEDVRGLARINAISLTDERWDYDAGRLVDHLRGIVAAPGRTIACPTCGRRNPAARSTCEQCGTPLATVVTRLGSVRVARPLALSLAAAMAVLAIVTVAALGVGSRLPATGSSRPAPSPSPVPLGQALPAAAALRCTVSLCADLPSAQWQTAEWAPDRICFAPTVDPERQYELCVSYASNPTRSTAAQLADQTKAALLGLADKQGVQECAARTTDTVLGLSGQEVSYCYTEIHSDRTFPARFTVFYALNQPGDRVYRISWFANAAYYPAMMGDPGVGRILNSLVWR